MEIQIITTPISQKKSSLEVRLNGESYYYETPYGDEDLKTEIFNGQIHEIATNYIDRIFQNEILYSEEMKNQEDFSVKFKFIKNGRK